MSQPPAGSRPTGVTILAVLSAIGGVFGLLAGLALIGGGAFLGSAGAVGVGGLFTIFGILVLVVAVASLAFAYGAWMLLPWAWTLGIASQVLGVIITLAEIVTGYASLTGSIVGIAISVIIVYYLDTPDVRRAFGRSPESWLGGLTNRKS